MIEVHLNSHHSINKSTATTRARSISCIKIDLPDGAIVIFCVTLTKLIVHKSEPKGQRCLQFDFIATKHLKHCDEISCSFLNSIIIKFKIKCECGLIEIIYHYFHSPTHPTTAHACGDVAALIFDRTDEICGLMYSS